MNSKPTLTEIRRGLPPAVSAWVDSVLEGKNQKQFAEEHGLARDSVSRCSAFFATVAGLEVDGRAHHIREAVLRMRIAELGARLDESLE